MGYNLNYILSEKKLYFYGNLFIGEERPISKLAEVLFSDISAEGPAYYMFRRVYRNPEDLDVMKEKDLRFDITIIPPMKFGIEYAKTYGHYHPKHQKVSFPEVYEIINGKAIILLQREKENVVEVLIIQAKEGDKIVIPPDFGHVTVNIGQENLVMSNWVSTRFTSLYGPFKERRGAAIYITEKGIIINRNYLDKELYIRQMAPPSFPEFGLNENSLMYFLIEEIDKLSFLNEPENFLNVFSKKYHIQY